MKGCRSAVSSRGSLVSTSKKPAPPPARLYHPLRLSGWRFPPAWCCSITRRATCSRVVCACHSKRQYQSMVGLQFYSPSYLRCAGVVNEETYVYHSCLPYLVSE